MQEGIDVMSPVRVLECIVVTPEATALKSPAQFIALPMYDGEIGIAPGHAPLIGRLGYGEMRLDEGNRHLRYYIDGGFVQVAGNMVSVMTSRAIPAEKLQADVAAEQLQAALAMPAAGEEQIAKRQRAVNQARAQLRVAQRASR